MKLNTDKIKWRYTYGFPPIDISQLHEYGKPYGMDLTSLRWGQAQPGWDFFYTDTDTRPE